MATGYTEAALVTNRTSVLLWGGTEQDRLAWATEAASHFPEGSLRVMDGEETLEQALHDARGVLFIPNVASLSHKGQLFLVRCLKEQEERPKIVAGLPGTQNQALDKGLLRPDLDYALSLARVDLDETSTREAIKHRRGKAPKASPSRTSAAKTQKPARRR